jgi:hypothetical protein
MFATPAKAARIRTFVPAFRPAEKPFLQENNCNCINVMEEE